MKSKNRIIVEYIKNNWADTFDNNNLFAKNHTIDEKTVRQIRESDTYNISLRTLIKICEAREITLEEFCRLAGV